METPPPTTDPSLSNDKPNETSLITKNPRRITQVCKYCNVEVSYARLISHVSIPSEDFISTHLNGKKHKVALDKAGVTPEEALHCVITLPNDPGIYCSLLQINSCTTSRKRR